MTNEIGYWFGWRLKDPVGSIVMHGPYSYDRALMERESSKAVDAEVTAAPFPARTESHALKIAHLESGLIQAKSLTKK